jgi:hypothetical protein
MKVRKGITAEYELCSSPSLRVHYPTDASNPWTLRPEGEDGSSEGLRPAIIATTKGAIRLFGLINYDRRPDIPDGVAEAIISD